MTDELSWLQQWYSAHCDGEWEHGPGITIETIDNPGWSMTILVEGTELESATFEPVKTDIISAKQTGFGVAWQNGNKAGRLPIADLRGTAGHRT